MTLPAPATLSDRLRAYRSQALRDDLVAALVVTVLLIPQSLAYALLAGLPAEVGLYASVLPALAYALVGSSRVLAIGPVAVVALMTAQATAGAGVAPAHAALVLAAEVGLLLAGAALLRLDALASLLSVPALHGFTSGASIAIAVSQLPTLLGASARGFNLPDVAQAWWHAEQPAHAMTAAFGLGALALLWWGRGPLKRWLAGRLAPDRALLLGRMAPLAVLLVTIALAVALDAGQAQVALVGALPPVHWPIALPPWDGKLWAALLPSAALIALVGYIESLAVGEALALRRHERIEPRRELAGMAAANVVAAVSSGMPVSGSFSRSAIAFDAGVRTRAAGAWTAVMMAVAMLLLAPLLEHLPRAVLAATIIVAVLSVLEWQPFVEAWRYERGEWAVMTGVALLTVFANVEWALGFGVALSVALLLKRTARPHVAQTGRVPGTEHFRNIDRHAVQTTPGVLSLRIDESLLFTNARSLLDEVAQHVAQRRERESAPIERVVLQMAPVNAIDYSGLEALRALQDLLARDGAQLDLSEVKGPVLDRLKAAGWDRWFRGRVYLSHHQAVAGEAG
jgi:sulfate permease, SulP family